VAEDRVLERAEGMFDGGSSQPHESGVARWCMRLSASSSMWRPSMRRADGVQRGFSEQAPQSAAEA